MIRLYALTNILARHIVAFADIFPLKSKAFVLEALCFSTQTEFTESNDFSGTEFDLAGVLEGCRKDC